MNTLRRLLYVEALGAILVVLLGFMALFAFFDLADELGALGRASAVDPQQVYTLRHALVYVLLQLPGRLYELMPIAVLIGTVYTLGRLAQGSEFVILRVSGLTPSRALQALLLLGAACVAVTFCVGEFLAPPADRAAQLLKAEFSGGIRIGQTGAWLKARDAERQFSVNVGSLEGDGELRSIRIFEFDHDGRLLTLTRARSGRVLSGGVWQLGEVQRTQMPGMDPSGNPASTVRSETLPEWRWVSDISTDMVQVALLKPERMGTLGLFNYVRHLEANSQTSQLYEIAFWRKVFYPLSCLVMVMLALPFAYLHFRSGAITAYVFVGIMIGISFFLLNNTFGYIGNLRQWAPWFAAAAPSLVYSTAGLGAFGWLVLRH